MPIMPTGVYLRTDYHRKIMSKHHADMKGDKNPCWRGGKTRSASGYALVYKPNHPKAMNGKYVPEHVLVMEEKISRYLTDNEVVHHINGIKDDNRIENLLLMTIKEHKSFHSKKDVCRRGHPLIGPNADVYINNKGEKWCRVCRRERDQKTKKKRGT